MSDLISKSRFTCALAAQQTVLAIPKGIPIIHAGPGCSDKAHGFVSIGAGLQGEGYAGGSNVVSTNSTEQEVVFGGEERLISTIEGALKVMKGDLFVVLSGCTADIVGDDTCRVAAIYAKQGYPVVGVEAGGFRGNNYYGHEIVVKSIIEQFIGEVKPKIKKGLVNVFGVVPYQNPYWRGDLSVIKNLVESIGLEVNILFGYESGGINEWNNIPNAEFNLLLSPWIGLSIVELLKQKYDTPFLQYPILPVGAQESSKFLKELGTFAGINSDFVEKVIQKEETKFYKYFSSIIDFIGEQRAALPFELYTVADSIYAIGITKFLVDEVGFIAKGIYITDDPSIQGKEVIQEIYDRELPEYKDLLVFEPDGSYIMKDIKDRISNSRKALILGSTWEKLVAEETKNLYGYISIPIIQKVILSASYLGYTGGVRFLEDIYSAPFTRSEFSANTRTELVVE